MPEIEKNNIILFSVLLTTILLFTLISFKRYYFDLNYQILAEVHCNSSTEQCFVGTCDPTQGECTGTEKGTFYYKKIERQANNTQLCDPEENGCPATTCALGELGCLQTFCDKELGEVCSSSD
jgi:hypothetical protein